MLGEEQLLGSAKRRIDRLELLLEQVALKELLVIHSGMALRKERKAAGREGEIGLDQPLEFHEGLFVKNDVIDVRAGRLRLPEGKNESHSSESAESCFLRVKRSSCAAATISPSRRSAAALS